MKKQLVFVLTLVIVFYTGAVVFPARAMTLADFSAELGCAGVSITGTYSWTFDRDNSGFGAEVYEFGVLDGRGKLLYYEARFEALGFSASGTDISIPYLAAAEYNPLTLIIYSPAGNGLPEQYVAVIAGECEGLPWAIQPVVPGYPTSFQQRTILCDVPVYDTPGGTPVGENMLKAGQTWYVNPLPYASPDGRAWAEVYVGGWLRPFVPTACVG